ncbi:MAG: hypothetical protein ACOC8B_03660 [Gemmatimonadota bacterium]
MAGLLLTITAVGFTPTFYLRFLFEAPPLTPIMVAHGVLSSLWILTFVSQVSLINGSRVRLHRRVGPVAGIIAGAMLASGVLLLHSIIQSADDLTAELARIGPLVWGNLAILAAFATFVVLGLWFRRRPDTHKRLMLLATVSMMGQPIVRIGQIEAIRISDVRVANDAIYGLGGLVVLLAVIVAYDVWNRGRPHRAVAIGAPALLGAIVFTGLLIPGSELGRSFILWWGGF